MSRNARAKHARDTINNVIPQLLKANLRAQAGIENTEMINHPPQATAKKPKSKKQSPQDKDTESAKIDSKEKEASSSTAKPTAQLPKITVIQADTYKAAQTLLENSPPNSRIAVLNMASPLKPGGGFLTGALAQEESLCARSTLYTALTQSPNASTYYRTPPLSLIYSPDILVFRDEDGKDLPKSEFFYTDVITAAAVRKPDLVSGAEGMKYSEEDREEMVLKVKAMFEVVKMKGVTHLVLGAWGCGAYRNPPEDVAEIFRRALVGWKWKKGVWGEEGCELVEVVFAIFDRGENLGTFEAAFCGLSGEEGDGEHEAQEIEKKKRG